MLWIFGADYFVDVVAGGLELGNGEAVEDGDIRVAFFGEMVGGCCSKCPASDDDYRLGKLGGSHIETFVAGYNGRWLSLRVFAAFLYTCLVAVGQVGAPADDNEYTSYTISSIVQSSTPNPAIFSDKFHQ